MSRFLLRRPRKWLERPRVWGLLALALSSGAAGAAYLTLHSIQRRHGHTAHPTLVVIITLGVGAISLAAATISYSLRKRRRRFQERAPGTLMAWFRLHLWIGGAAFLVAMIHSAVPPLQVGASWGKIALALLAVIMVSGLLWRLAYTTIPPRVAERVGNLSVEDLSERIDSVRAEIERMIAGRSPQLHRAVSLLLEGSRPSESLDVNVAEEAGQEWPLWEGVKPLAARLVALRKRAALQHRYARLLQDWRLLHIPLAVAFFAVVIIHVLDVMHVPARISGTPPGFVAASQCSSCHVRIADQWQASMLAHSQLSPIDIAQTKLALSKFPEFGQFCVNCHAPMGAQLTGETTFPQTIPADHAALVNEGIGCAACHTLHGLPDRGSGALSHFPVVPGTRMSLGTVIGPPLTDPPPLPVPDHDVATGFMTDPAASSRLCGACHQVARDLNGDGKAEDREHDLVLQTTYQEWLDYRGGGGEQSCVSCHMRNESAPLVRFPPGGFAPVTRPRVGAHTFVGVDYDLAPNAYSRGETLNEVLKLRDALLGSAATLTLEGLSVKAGKRLVAVVKIKNVGAGHDLPTGFAFVRQMWIDISATTASGRPVCLSPVREIPGHPIRSSTCSSGHLTSPDADLLTCDPLQLRALGDTNAPNIQMIDRHPLDRCDPWLTNLQKVLTDGDPNHDGKLIEVPYQSPLPEIVQTQSRVVRNQSEESIPPGQSAKFRYVFDVSALKRGDIVTVDVALRFRHLPPYFIWALDGFLPSGISPTSLLRGLRLATMATDTAAIGIG